MFLVPLVVLGAVHVLAWVRRRRDDVPPMRRTAVALLAATDVLVVALVGVGVWASIVLAHLLALVMPLAGMEPTRPVVDWQLATALLDHPLALAGLSALAATAGLLIWRGRATTPDPGDPTLPSGATGT